MDFENDPQKNLINLEKHGIDFEKAKVLWEDQRHLVIPARTQGEKRWLIIGRIESRIWSAVITYRGEKIRIISVRRSRNEEIVLYEDDRI